MDAYVQLPQGLHLCRLVLWFLRIPVDKEGTDPYQYVATILNNVTRVGLGVWLYGSYMKDVI